MYDGKTILLVEDDEFHYHLVKRTLSKFDMALLWAENGQQALSLCAMQPHIDLILMDLQMPTMDGYTARSAIKAKFPSVPIVAITAFTMVDNVNKTLAAGFNSYVTKPLRPKVLEAVLEKYLT